MVKTYADLVEWIKAECEAGKDYEGTAEEAAMWFCALQHAIMMRETMTNKDLAHMLMRGVDQWSKDDCNDEILRLYDEGLSDQDVWDQLSVMLNCHFFGAADDGQDHD